MMDETKRVRIAGRRFSPRQKKCKHCGEWLAEEIQRESPSANDSAENLGIRYPLLIPVGTKFWGWFTGIAMFLSTRPLHSDFYRHGGSILNVLWDLMLFWGFLLFVEYMKNFKREIPLLKFLPWCFLASAVVGLVSDETLSDGAGLLLSVLGTGILVFIFYIARQLMKFSEDPMGRVKSLGDFMFIANLVLVVSLPFFILYYLAGEDGTMVEGIADGLDFVVSLVTYILLLRVFRKARRCSKSYWGEWKPAGVEKEMESGMKEATSVPFSADLTEDSVEEGKMRERKKRLSKRRIGMLLALGLVVIGVVVWMFVESRKPEYFLCVGRDWVPNKDYSCHISIVSNVEADAYSLGKEWQGDLTIAVSDGPGSKIVPVLSSSDVCHSKEFHEITRLTPDQAVGLIASFYPSTKFADMVYFDYFPCTGYGSEDFSVYGKVNVRTKEFALYPGILWGIIAKGSYANCYLCERNGLMHIFPQSGIGDSSDPVAKFKLSDYIKYDEENLYDSGFREEVIKWLENQ